MQHIQTYIGEKKMKNYIFETLSVIHCFCINSVEFSKFVNFEFCLFILHSSILKPPWQPPNRFHLLLQISGMHCLIICRPFQLFLLLEELSNIPYSCLLTLTVVQNLVRSNQLNVSHFVIQHQLRPSHSPEIPCRPSKGVPSERLRLVKVIHFA